MTDDLLQTKFYLPRVQQPLVPRPRLVEKLNAGLDRRLSLISAPAGFGKTTLLSEWLANFDEEQIRHPTSDIPHHYGWLSLDERDNDLTRFMTYLAAAVKWPSNGEAHREAPLLDQDVISHYANARPADVETLMMILINGITAVRERVILILDDYHLISLAQIHRALDFLLEHMPPNLHLVIGTRSDPPLALARLRGRGQLAEIRQDDLQFTADEAALFLEQAAGVQLAASEVAALVKRTEGWPAGLQMAAISLSASDDTSAFIHDFTGSNRHVLDYLLGEVLDGQPPEIERFLLQTAILDRLNAPLCAAVLEGEEAAHRPPGSAAQQILEQLERSNLFVTPLDNERGWYRYHRLFADLLRFTLRKRMPQKIPLLQQRASAWFEENGFVVEAIDYALFAGDFERAARLLEEQAEYFLQRGEIALLLRRLDDLPENVLVERPSLCIYQAWTRLLAGHPLAEVEGRLSDAGEDGAVSAVALVFKSLIAVMLGDAARSLALSGQALELLPEAGGFGRVEGSAYWRSMVFNNRGMAYVLSGDEEAAIEAFEQCARIGGAAGNKMAVVSSLSNLAGLVLARGQLHQSAASYRRALDLATDAQGNKLPVAQRVLLGLGELAREWNQLAEAEDYFQESLALSRRYAEIGRLMSLLHLARVKGAQGEGAAAGELFAEARQLALKSEAVALDDLLVEISQARHALEQGDLAAAERWARSVRRSESGARTPGPAVPQEVREVEQLLLARLDLARGKADEALALLEPLLDTAGQRDQKRRLIEILGFTALAQQAHGDEAEALETITQALGLAEPEGYVRIFVDAGEGMAHLLAKALTNGIAVDYCRRLLQAFQGGGAFTPQPLVEPLSERELEVLQLIGEGLSNREIAARLVISLSTVKGHTANIYGKLGVHRRTSAVARARELGLLSS